MLLNATPHIIISFIRAFRGLVPSQPGPDNDLANLSDPLFIAKNIFFIVQTLFGDGVNIWRFYVIYGRKVWPISVPLIIMSAGIVSGCVVIRNFAVASEGLDVFNIASRWIKVYDVLMISTNVYCTAAIAWKIYRSTRYRRSNLGGTHHALIVITETGVLYTSSLVIFLITYLSGSNGQYVTLDLVTPFVPCIFCLMILQIQLGRSSFVPSYPASTFPMTPVSVPETPESAWMKMCRMLKGGPDPSTAISPRRPVQIQISTTEEAHNSGDDIPKITMDPMVNDDQ
ncbi:hypothetical protein EWM64_g7465 [Hericium alpestre]|uniref:Uncharacterized protein n=1 Tax=Hericium alpestre TaxID=135208 RepID=A0A4Y9ZNU9_9AGAM|nr:hypothetical protein EWM64_g7465 [Hericium alpestre]